MLPFVPRKVAQASRTVGASASSSRIPSRHNDIPTSSTNLVTASDSDQQIDAKGKGKAGDVGLLPKACYTCLCLALSDHAIWSDAHLRSRLVNASDGYVPLRYLLSRPNTLSMLNPPPTETIVAKAIRAQSDGALEVRVLVSAPSRSAWYGKDSAKDQLGGYEVRRRDWADVLQRIQQLTEDHWAASTIYAENIPFQHRTIAGIAQFVQALLASPTPTHSVQSIWLPPHVHDKPGDAPKCKGFALITLSNPEQAEELTRNWPWTTRRTNLQGIADIPESQEAVKFGFRTMTRARWDELQDEYLSYRRTLLEAMAHSGPEPEESTKAAMAATVGATEPSSAPSHPPPATDFSSPYPRGCLVFVRNIHPETNKTTLRSLFSQAFANGGIADAGVDYVDFNKGMDTCYLRLASARHTQILTSFFIDHPKAQVTGLDTSGSTPLSERGTNVKAIALEVVEGTREELYWNKVPEKVRRQAVEKAAAATGAQPAGGDGRAAGAPVPSQGKRKRKRKREE